mgnify:CR=1 FL=1
MAEDKKLSVTADAADVVREVRSYNHGAPSGGEMASASGVEVGPAQIYTNTLSGLGVKLEATFQELLSDILSACDHSQLAIQQMHELDDEIGMALRLSESDIQTTVKAVGKPNVGKNHQW